MSKHNGGNIDIRFTLIPDNQVLANLLPIVAGLAFSRPIVGEEVDDICEATEDSDTCSD